MAATSNTPPLDGVVRDSQHEGAVVSASTIDSEAKVQCRFWGTKNGCRAGDKCRFYHPPNNATSSPPPREQPTQHAKSEPRRYQAPAVDRSKVVTKPSPQAQQGNPREYQLQQVRRRFNPIEITLPDSIVLEIKLAPSDPDFPFEMDALDCKLEIPTGYPKSQKPWLLVRNQEMSRGYQINVEKGFDAIVKEFPNSTLLGWMNILDRRLEEILTGEKAETIKLVANRGPPIATPAPAVAASAPPANKASPAGATASHVDKPRAAAPSYSREALDTASQRREVETRQLEARLGRMPLYVKAADGLCYTLPIEPRRREQLPVPLQSIKTLRLYVPRLYPLQPCRLELQGVTRDSAKQTEKEFDTRAKSTAKEQTLLAQLNHLTQNVHVFATKTEEPEPAEAALSEPEPTAREPAAHPETMPKDESLDDRSHIHIIPRPMEWEPGYDDGDSDSDASSTFSDYDAIDTPSGESDEHDEEPAESSVTAAVGKASGGPERGVALSFPNIVLQNISLLAPTSLSLVVSCGRCKTRNEATVTPTKSTSVTCSKCSSELTLALRPELVHANNARAGYIDCGGCAVADLQSADMTPTCASCGAEYRTGLTAARGSAADGVCRDCHARLRAETPEAKFLAVGGAAQGLPPRRRPKDDGTQGTVAGTPLPRSGLCAHYRHSHRWFRFACCNKVFPCDRCHDAQTGHKYEHGNRMVCGWCSREQPFRSETCAICGRFLVRAKGNSGFWEGGRGTRDRKLMSRKDPRKFKRSGEAKRAEKKKAKGE